MRRVNTLICILLLTILLGLTGQPAAGAPTVALSDTIVYTDSLAAGWENWSWGSTVNLSAASPVHGGTAAVSVGYNAAWGGLYLHSSTNLSAWRYESLRFWINGGATGGQQIKVKLIDANDGNWDNGVVITVPANAWSQVTVTLNQVGGPATIAGIVLQDNNGAAQAAFTVDDIRLVGSLGGGSLAFLPSVFQNQPATTSSLSVDAAQNRHAISPLIYGMNYAAESLAAELRLPVRRWGGNSTTRYNYLTDTHNTGSDWYFENIVDYNPANSPLPDGSSANLFIEQNRRTGSDTLLTVPLIGWVPKPKTVGVTHDCGFRVSKYGAQTAVDPYDADCGSGVATGGGNIVVNTPTDTSQPVDASFVAGWVNYLKSRYGSAAGGTVSSRGVRFYNLDNEPMLWSDTHRDVHAAETTYDELRDLTYQYAAAIKQADPAAQTLGPVLWGWCAYLYSARDGCAPGADYAAHGSIYFVEWYLQQMRAYEQQHSTRLLDYLDLHYYPQGQGVFATNPGGAATQALRLRSTRSLWDPTYLDNSWIPEPVYLIPRMKAWAANNYPGTKLAISEYSWGAMGSLNGALAQADVLGIFGREGLDLATLWDPPSADQPGAYAFRMFRNYNGAGGAFGETSVRATSANLDNLTIYAALRSSDSALTVMVINKTGDDLSDALSLANFFATTAQVYRYSGANLNAIVRQADQPLAGGRVTVTYPANSITLLMIK